MFRSISQSPDWYLCILLYNFFAFATQMPIGIIADKLDRNFLFACAGCLLIAAGYGLAYLPQTAAIVIGLGNGLFHIGGGIDVLNISEEKSGALGVFVSPGAFGIYFGTILGRGDRSLSLVMLMALLAAAVAILITRIIKGETYAKNAPFSPEASAGAPVAIVCLFLVVCLRSFAGLTISFPWKGAGYWGLALVCATVFGKTAGGFLSDRFGPLKTAVFSLGLATTLFLASLIPAAGVTSVLLFNMTMPITLWVMAKIFPGAKGFSFGLLTFGLFLGFLPVYLGAGSPPPRLFAIISAASLLLLLIGLARLRGGSKTDRG